MSPTLGANAHATSDSDRIASEWSRVTETAPVLLATSAGGATHVAAIAARVAADSFGVQLQVISVLEPSIAEDWLMGAGAIPPLAVEDALSARGAAVRSFLAQSAVAINPDGVAVRYGPVQAEIARMAQELMPSLLVVGSTPRMRRGQYRAGAVAAQLLRAVGCPVLAAMPPARAGFDRVIAAIDFSPASVHAARTALRLMKRGGAMTLLHVDAVSPFAPPTAPINLEDQAESFRRLSRLRTAFADVAAEGVTIDIRQVTGDPEFWIAEFATKEDAQLITVGTHRGGPIDRVFLGSVAATVLHTAMCSVLGAGPPRADQAFAIQLSANGSVTSADQEAWALALTAFTRRNVGRKVRLEVDDPDLGAETQAYGYQFLGAGFDAREGRLEIMLAASANSRDHLSRSITGISSIAVMRDDENRDAALEVRSGATTSRLSFLVP